MTHVELLEQHEARLRLYARLLDGVGSTAKDARAPILDLVRREVAEAEEQARRHLSRLHGEEEREAFQYTLTLLLPYYTHLARIYGKGRRGAAAMPRGSAAG